MNIITITKNGQELKFLDRFPQEIKNNTFTYFIIGEGYKKTKKFKLSEVELPDLKSLSWLEICRIYEKHGWNIALEYSNCKVAGIIASGQLNGYYQLYDRCKDILNTLPDAERFFESIPLDYMLAQFLGYGSIDIIKYDYQLSKNDPDYDCENAKYKGEPCSLNDYISLTLSPNHANVIGLMLEHKE